MSDSLIGDGPIWPEHGALEPLSDCLSGLGCTGLFIENSPSIFLIMTVVIAGACAFMSGRSLALSWRPLPLLLFYMALFGFAVRFLHWGLFRGALLSPWYYATDTLVLMGIAAFAWQLTRTSQMVTNYHWLYRRTSLLTWAQR